MAGLSGLDNLEVVDSGLGAVNTVVAGPDIVGSVEVVVDGAASEECDSTGTGLSTGGEGVPERGVDRAARLATAV